MRRNAMKINIEDCSIPITTAFAELLEGEITKSGVDPQHGVILNFRDPDYSVESGGYHPVEIMISKSATIAYVTEFSYCVGQFPELVKELDWDIMANVFGHMGMRDYPIEQGAELYSIFQSNFISYYQRGVFTVSVSSMG
jgi:hypothetical protein